MQGFSSTCAGSTAVAGPPRMAAAQHSATMGAPRTPEVVATTVHGMRVLAIDGGGIRGLIPALVLAELEDRAERQVFEMFDLIAGTSTGGILACALCAPEPLPASELVKLYEEEGPKIFDRYIFQRIKSGDGLLDEKYDDAALDRALERFLGTKRLAEARPDLIVPSYDTALPGPYFFKTSKAREAPETA